MALTREALLAELAHRYGPLPDLPGAACRGRAPLHDDKVHGETPEQQSARYAAAVRVCSGCPVQARCAALLAEQPPGRWSGVGVMAGRVLAVQQGHRHNAA